MAANGFRHSTISNMWGIGSYNVIGENIAMGYGSGTTAGTLHVAWMNSSGHRENMLSPQFDSVGIGVFCAADGSMWATTSFADRAAAGPRPRAPACRPSIRSCGATPAPRAADTHRARTAAARSHRRVRSRRCTSRSGVCEKSRYHEPIASRRSGVTTATTRSAIPRAAAPRRGRHRDGEHDVARDRAHGVTSIVPARSIPVREPVVDDHRVATGNGEAGPISR